jgi:hypothetical protein
MIETYKRLVTAVRGAKFDEFSDYLAHVEPNPVHHLNVILSSIREQERREEGRPVVRSLHGWREYVCYLSVDLLEQPMEGFSQLTYQMMDIPCRMLLQSKTKTAIIAW